MRLTQVTDWLHRTLRSSPTLSKRGLTAVTSAPMSRLDTQAGHSKYLPTGASAAPEKASGLLDLTGVDDAVLRSSQHLEVKVWGLIKCHKVRLVFIKK